MKRAPKKAGALLVIDKGSLYITGGDLDNTMIDCDLGDAILFLGVATYEEALEEGSGVGWGDLEPHQKNWDRDEPMWRLLWKEQVFFMPQADCLECLKPVSKRSQQ